ncbi:hypothetical protein C0Q91_18910 [Streptomyces albidoflavus]|uniref:Uncharacterized protein n=1 Tax=Streptomyces albidoflavus TaxID=1886 RepID=A0AB37XBC8_9ACTN|nr:hypothetical protein C0Q91_18910 [Streptomyces albidoflavus]
MACPAALVGDGDGDGVAARARAVVARPMRREWPVQATGTPARWEMRVMARVTESGPCRR